MLLGESYRNLTCRRGDDLEVAGYAVGSNSTGFIHSEQWIDLDQPPGADQAGRRAACRSSTRRSLPSATRASSENGRGRQLQTAWLGTHRRRRRGGRRSSTWNRRPCPAATSGSAQRDRSPQTCDSAVPGELNLHGLLEIAQRSEDLRPGEIRLVAWSDDALPGLVVEPAAKQWRHAALVVAHLTAGDEDLPRPIGAPPRRSPSETDESCAVGCHDHALHGAGCPECRPTRRCTAGRQQWHPPPPMLSTR